MPYILGQAEVKRSWTEELNPLQVAKEDITTKTLALYDSLKSDDTRIIQLQLQGSIQATVNQVRFILKKKVSKIFQGPFAPRERASRSKTSHRTRNTRLGRPP